MGAVSGRGKALEVSPNLSPIGVSCGVSNGYCIVQYVHSPDNIDADRGPECSHD